MTPDDGARAAEAARIVEAVAAQRDLVARHLHDEAVQSVSVAALRVELVRGAVGPGVGEVDELRDVLRSATTQIRAVMDSLRRPNVVGGELARSLRDRLAAAGGPVSVVDDLTREPPEPVGMILHWTAEECVRVLRRGDAAISVVLRSPDEGFTLEVVAAAAEGGTSLTEPPEGAQRFAAMIGGAIAADTSTPRVTRLAVLIPWRAA